MKRFSLSILLVLGIFFAVHAGDIKGTVLNNIGERVAFATVFLKESNTGGALITGDDLISAE